MLKDQIAGKNSSWAIRWYASAFIKNKLTLYPGKSFVRNVGVDGTGTHGGIVNVYYTELPNIQIVPKDLNFVENKKARKAFELFFRRIHSKFFRGFILVRNILKKLMKKINIKN